MTLKRELSLAWSKVSPKPERFWQIRFGPMFAFCRPKWLLRPTPSPPLSHHQEIPVEGGRYMANMWGDGLSAIKSAIGTVSTTYGGNAG